MPSATAADTTGMASEFDQAVGRRIYALMTAQGLDDEDMAARVKLARETVNRQRRGKRAYSASQLPIYARALGVPVSALLPEDEMPPETRTALSVLGSLSTGDQKAILAALVAFAQARREIETAERHGLAIVTNRNAG